jgi:hypothetical protein
LREVVTLEIVPLVKEEMPSEAVMAGMVVVGW